MSRDLDPEDSRVSPSAEMTVGNRRQMDMVEDAKWGEVGHLFWVAAGDLDARTINAAIGERLARYKAPKHYTQIEALPGNAAGKVQSCENWRRAGPTIEFKRQQRMDSAVVYTKASTPVFRERRLRWDLQRRM